MGWSGGGSCACTYALGYDHNLKTGNISHYIQLNSKGLKEFVTVWTTISIKSSKYNYFSIKWNCIYFCDDSYYVVLKFFTITSLFKICFYIISSAPWSAWYLLPFYNSLGADLSHTLPRIHKRSSGSTLCFQGLKYVSILLFTYFIFWIILSIYVVQSTYSLITWVIFK